MDMNSLRGLMTVALLAGAGAAQGALVPVELVLAVNGVSTGLQGAVASGDTITGSFVVDTGRSGVFTASANPQFGRDEILYAGAIENIALEVAGETLTGSGGDLELLDSGGALAGEDNYGVSTALSSSSLAGIAATSVDVVLEYGFATVAIDANTLSAPPPAFDSSRFNPFNVAFESGNFLGGQISSMTVIPLPGALWLLAPALVGVLAAARRQA